MTENEQTTEDRSVHLVKEIDRLEGEIKKLRGEPARVTVEEQREAWGREILDGLTDAGGQRRI